MTLTFSPNNPVNSEINLTLWAPRIATVSMSTVGGFILGGPFGAGIGLATSLIDEYLNYDKHYLSTSAFWATTTVYPLYNLALTYTPYGLGQLAATAIATAGFALPHLTEDFLDFKNKLKTPIESFFTINTLFDKNNTLSVDEIKKIYNIFLSDPHKAWDIIQDDIHLLSNNPFLTSFLKNSALEIVKTSISFLFLHYLSAYSHNSFIYNLLSLNSGLQLSDLQHLSPYIKEAAKILGVFFLKNEIEFYIESQENAISTDQYQIVLQQSIALLVEKENGRRVLSTPKGKELVQNLTPDLTKLVYKGAGRLNYILSQAVETLTALLAISRLAPNILAPYAILSVIHQNYVKHLSTTINRLFKKHSEGEVPLWDIKYDIANNIDQINLRQGESFVSHQFSTILTKQNTLLKQMEYYEKLKASADKRTSLLGESIDVYHYALLVLTAHLKLGSIPILKRSVDTVYEFIASNLNLGITSKELNLAQERVNTLFKIIESPSSSKTIRVCNTEGKIILNDYELQVNDDPILRIDHFEFLPQKRYALTGRSGCGKSSFLIDLMQGVLGALSSSGSISMGDFGKKMFINQELYLPADSTLFETVCFPTILSSLKTHEIEKLKSLVISLFRELEIDKGAEAINSSVGLISLLDSKDFKLSGGQTKKIAIIQAILNNPDLLFMDETLTALDEESLILVIDAILKYLPKVTLISVDHKAKDNNYQGFYQSNIHFSKDEDNVGKIEEIPIEIKASS